MSDKGNRKDLGDELRDSLDDLVQQSLASNDGELPSVEVNSIDPLDFKDVSDKARKKAQKTVISCLKLYFDENIITKNEFLQSKSAVATSTIMTLFSQLKMSEHMMHKIINEIDNGNAQPRMFEVATNVQNTIIEILKNTQLHIISMQEDFKRVKNELPLSEQQRQQDIDITPKRQNTFLNAKNMLKDLEEDEVEDDEENDD